MTVRMTNMDSVAAVLNKDAAKGDLIVLNPWTHASPSGGTITARRPGRRCRPPDHRTHRYDLIRDLLAAGHACRPS